MSGHPCCSSNKETAEARIAKSGPRLAQPARAARSLAGMIFPSALLVLLPKCPACIAAYMAMGTGIGLSMAAASYLRFGIVGICVSLLGYLAMRSARSLGFAFRFYTRR